MRLLRNACCMALFCGLIVRPAGILSAAETSIERTTLAFPGAEGYGRFAQGGRGGGVYHVTNLNDSGPGSFRDGIDSIQGPRTIVFEVSGTIELKSQLKIEANGLTIAGQTAPGDGITFKDNKLGFSKSSDIIVRYIRVRLGDKNKPRPSGPDAVSVNNCDHLIFDHVSVSWGIVEVPSPAP